jgi:hypothetical protein
MNSALNPSLHHAVKVMEWNVSWYTFSYLGWPNMTCGEQHGNACSMEYQQFYWSTLTACFTTKNGASMFLQNNVMHPPASCVATQNTTVLQSMFNY